MSAAPSCAGDVRHLLVRGALCASLVVALTTAFASAGGATVRTGAAAPTTLVTVHGRIGGFAQDGERIAWLWPTARCRDFVQLRNLSGKQVRLAAPRGATCPPADAYVEGALALAGDRALWVVYDRFGGNTVVDYRVYVVEGRVGKPDRVIDRREYEESKDDYGDAALPSVPMASDGGTLAYAFGASLKHDLSGHGVPLGKLARPDAFALSGGRLAVASTTSAGGCLCNAGPSWSPDGGRLAFASARDGTWRVYVAPAAGGEPTAIADGIGPSWSPNGQKIALAHYTADDTRQLVVVGVNGGDPVVVPAFEWAWSPDGGRLAIIGDDGSLSVISTDGTVERALAANGQAPAWSPDGTRIAFIGSTPDGDRSLQVVNVDGSGTRIVQSGYTGAPAWSTDGTELLVARDGVLKLIAADGTGSTQLTHPGKGLIDGGQSWSPDGRRIVFERGRYDEETDGFVQTRIWLMNADGTGEHRLTSAVADESDPAWSPDGAKIAFARGGELYVAGTDGAGEARVTTTHPTEPRSAGSVYAAASGAKINGFETVGRVRAVALSPSVLAVLVEGFFGKRIELFDPGTGTELGSVAVDATSAAALSAAGDRIVFAVGRRIMMLDVATRRLSQLAVAGAPPLGLSIEGRRVAWAENAGNQGRIRALTAP
jgi:TolB protein